MPSARRSRTRRPRSKRKVALVCAGGGITGAVYEIGCLRALDELLDRSVLDLDRYVGISGGAVVASLTAAGRSPAEMYDEATSRRGGMLGTTAAPIYGLGGLEFLKRSVRAHRVLTDAIKSAATREGRNLSDVAWSVFEMLPPGLLDSSGVQKFLHRLFRSRLRSDSFPGLPRTLLVVAVDIDTGEAITFGQDGSTDVPVSKAVQASIALPGLYRPVRIGGRPLPRVAHRPGELGAHPEVVRRTVGPAADHAPRGDPVVRGVRLHRIEVLAVLGEEVLRLRAGWIERPDPFLRGPGGGADADAAGQRSAPSRSATRRWRSLTWLRSRPIRACSANCFFTFSMGRAGMPQ